MSEHYDWNRALRCEIGGEPSCPEILDTIIIGAGPAGMTAGIYAARRKMKTLMICGTVGGQMKWASDIENWTGVAKATGPELTNQFFAHIKKIDDDNHHFDLWVHENEKVTNIVRHPELVEGSLEKQSYFTITTDHGDSFQSKTIIITSGKKPRVLGIPGEDIAMQGNGLSFAATSDAPLYVGKKMVVIGGGNSAMDVSLQLAKYTDDITIMTNVDTLIGETCLMHRVEQNPAIKIRYNIDTKEILLNNQNKVSGIRLAEEGNDEEVFECQGIFEEIGHTPATSFVENLTKFNAHEEIIVDRQMKTSVRGIFAAGDCTNEIHKQTIVAAGQGAIAALEAHEYILKS